jgi:serine/threonine-protein kinase RsbT
MTIQDQGEVRIETEADIAVARRAVRDLAAKIGFGITETARIVTAVSELGRNVHKYAGGGVMQWHALKNGGDAGLELRFEDQGPGIADINEAMREGYSTGGGLGMGLPGAKRLMDHLDIQSTVGKGTTVTVRKWRRR